MASAQQRPSIGAEFSLATLVYVLLGVPFCTAVMVYVPGLFMGLLLNGGSVDPAGMEFWSGVAFFLGSLGVVGTAVRAWRRVRRGESSFFQPVVTRLVPALMALGVFGALVLGGFTWRRYVAQLESEADRFCFTWHASPELPNEECMAAARACLEERPADESPGSGVRLLALRSCMEKVRPNASPPVNEPQ